MLAAVPAEGWEEAIRPQFLFFQFSGLMIVLLLTGLVYFTINRQAALAQAVEQRTKEISIINENLEQRVANRTKELSALYDVMAVANSSLDLQDVMIESLAQIIEVMDCEIGSIHLLDHEHRVLNLAAWQGTPVEVLPQIRKMPLGYGVAGQVMAHGKPLVVPAIELESNAVPAANQVLAGHAYVGSPMKAKGNVLGVLSVIGPIGKTFDEEEVSLLASIADQVGVAVENAQLYKQAEELAIAEERQRMAREIHDTLAQGLTGIKLQLDAVESALEYHREELALERLSKARQLSSESLTEARRSVWALNSKSLVEKKITKGLRDSIRGLTEGTGIEVKFDIFEEIPTLPSELESDLLRIAQEAVVNAVKHANANKVHIYLGEEGDGILLKVQDDGKGFTRRDDQDKKVDGSGFGLIAMQDRINRHGGSLTIESEPNQGTTIIAKVNL
jgi:signal transduction histidine kinase